MGKKRKSKNRRELVIVSAGRFLCAIVAAEIILLRRTMSICYYFIIEIDRR